MPKLGLIDLELDGRLVLLRVDYNVPLDGGRVADDTRIAATLPTLRFLIQKKARVVLCSHLGRPGGKPDPKLSLRPVMMRLQQLLHKASIGTTVGFCPDIVGRRPEGMAAQLGPGSLLLIENLRFDPGEEKNDDDFASKLANLGELYVNDAFGAAHRAHASTVGVTRYYTECAAGYLMERELDYLGRLLRGEQHPYLVVLGGAKVGDKLPVIENLAGKADQVLVGGGMTYTLMQARGLPVGKSLVDPAQLAAARRLLEGPTGGRFLLPVDHVVSSGIEDTAGASVVETIPDGMAAFDIGPRTRELYSERIATARMLFWNGPMGVFERPPFDAGTLAVAKAVALCAGTTVAGGGDSIAALNQAGIADQVTHVSTGGGASLEYLAGDELPGVAALTNKA